MEKEQSYFMVIPASVWDSELSAKAMILYGHITVLANKKGFCFASNDYFAKQMRCNARTIQRCFVELESNNLITRENVYKEDSKEVDMRKIYLSLANDKNVKRPNDKNVKRPVDKNVTRPVDKNVIDKDTRFNTTRDNITRSNNKKLLNPLTLGQEAILDDSFAKQEPYSNDELMVLSIDI